MARGVLFSFLSFILVSCSIIDPPFPGGRPRCSEVREHSIQTPPAEDVPVLVSAVDFPAGYDWRRDSLYGDIACRLLLFRDGVPILEIPAGKGSRVSPAPDRHHLLDGHLYTDYCDGDGTTVGMDGTALFSFPEQEIICGILRNARGVCTLGRNRSGSGFSFRIDGKPVIKKASGTPFGGFGVPGYGPGGGLYEVDGHILFAYCDGPTVYFVSDGEESIGPTSGFRAVDAKYLDGQQCVLFNEGGKNSMLVCGNRAIDIGNGLDVFWLEGGIIEYDGLPAVAGSFLINGEALLNSGLFCEQCYFDAGFDAFLQLDGTRIFGAGIGPDGSLLTLDLTDPGSISFGSAHYYFPRPECFRRHDGSDMLALTPLDKGKAPFLRVDGEDISFNINGYLTGIL